MIGGEKLHVDAPDRQIELVEPDGSTAAGVYEELLVAGLNTRAGAEAVGARDRHAGPEQCHAEVAGGHELKDLHKLDFDPCVLDDLGPADDLAMHQFAERFWGAAARIGPNLGERLAHLVDLERLVDGL